MEYEGGSPEAEPAVFDALARDIMLVQEKNRRRSGAAAADRAFHAKGVLGVEDARLVVRDDLSPELQQGCFKPGAELPASVRLSNAGGMPQHDTAEDLRGVAMRIDGGDGRVHDLLLTSFEVSPTADAREFVAMARAVAGRSSTVSRLPVDERHADVPDPIRVSTELLTRERFTPARSLNVLAAAWIHFQVHDWVNHHPVQEHSIDLPITGGREWRDTVGGPVEEVMRIAETDGDGNVASHWWDGSEVYGASDEIARSLRERDGAGSRLRLEDGYLPGRAAPHRLRRQLVAGAQHDADTFRARTTRCATRS